MLRKHKRARLDRYASVRTMRKTILPMAALALAFTVVFSVESWHTRKREQVRDLAALAELAAAGLNAYLVQLEGMLRLTAPELVRGIGKPGTTMRIEQVVRETYPELQGLTVVTLDSHHPDADKRPHRTPLSPSAYAASDGEIVVERPIWHEEIRDWIIPVRYPLRGIGGPARHAIHATLPIHAAHQLWRDAALPQGGRIGVIRDDGHLVALHPPPAPVYAEKLYGAVRTKSPLYKHVRESGFPYRGTVEGAGSLDGRRRIWVYRRLESYPLTLYTSYPAAHLWETWWQQVRYSYLLLIVGVVGGTLVYRWIVQRQCAWELARERAEKRIRRLNTALAQRVAQLEASNRELEAFSYTVSHDLRGPLRVMHGFSDRLATQYGDRLEAQGAHYIERIKLGAQRMGALVDGLLQLARVARSKVELQPVDLTHEAKSIVRELRQLHPDRAVRFQVDEGITARGSPPLLRNLLRNLLENAWKFTAERSDATVTFSSEQRDGERLYVVRDNGVGFDMRYAAKLFTVFHRLHGADYDGMGVGLATVARIVAMHGGRIWAEAEKNVGAAFCFALAPRASH